MENVCNANVTIVAGDWPPRILDNAHLVVEADRSRFADRQYRELVLPS
jgi:hypothetical protein